MKASYQAAVITATDAMRDRADGFLKALVTF